MASTAESTNQNDNHDDTPTTMSVYPMTIDDFQACSIHHGLMDIDGDENNNYNRVRMIEYQQFVEYHAAIILYNFGIIHQCLGMTEDDPAMMDSDEAQNHAGSANSGVVSLSTTRAGPDSLPMAIDTSGNRNMAVDHQPYDDQNDDVSSERLLASYKILTNTLSWIHELVRPIMDDIMNDGNDDASHTNMEISSSIATSSPDDQYYMNKYLQVMVLINYHVLDIIDTLQFPDGPYQYHCTMMNEILNFISYLEIFYPMTSSNINDHSNSIGHGNTRGSASPAA